MEMMTTKTEYTLPKKAKGARPYFFEDPSQDKLLAMLMGLVGEVSILVDRVDTLERILVHKGVLTEGCVDTYIVDPAAREARDTKREQLLGNVLRIINQDQEDPDGGKPNDQAYMSVVDQVGQ